MSSASSNSSNIFMGKDYHRFCTLHCPVLAYRNEIFTGADRTSPLAHNLST